MLEESGRGGRREAGRDFEDRSRESNRIDAAIGNGCAHDGAAEGDFETGRNGEAVVDGARFTPAGGCIEIERARVAGGVDEAELDSRQGRAGHAAKGGTLLNAEPTVGSAPPWAGVTPVP